MKIGPVHVIRQRTYERWTGLERLLMQSAGVTVSVEQAHGLMHPAFTVRNPDQTVPPVEPDAAADARAAGRVVEAYHRAIGCAPRPPAPGLWDRITRERQPFLDALARGSTSEVAAEFGRMFASPLVWGLGQFHASHPDLLRSSEPTHLHIAFVDALVSLAEAVGVARVTNVHQDAVAHFEALGRDPERLYRATVERLGFDPAFPEVGGAYGFRLQERLVTIDSLVHAWTAYRLRQIAGEAASAFEIGGGYGGLALLATRAGFAEYAIFDLPWVNALQGFFLLRAVPDASIELYGEDRGAIRVLPYWTLDEQPDAACDVLVNTDSLAEIGEATAHHYLQQIARVTRRCFLSINQEAMAEVEGGRQICVRARAEASGALVPASRHRAWMRHGYVEESFLPKRDGR